MTNEHQIATKASTLKHSLNTIYSEARELESNVHNGRKSNSDAITNLSGLIVDTIKVINQVAELIDLKKVSNLNDNE